MGALWGAHVGGPGAGPRFSRHLLVTESLLPCHGALQGTGPGGFWGKGGGCPIKVKVGSGGTRTTAGRRKTWARGSGFPSGGKVRADPNPVLRRNSPGGGPAKRDVGGGPKKGWGPGWRFKPPKGPTRFKGVGKRAICPRPTAGEGLPRRHPRGEKFHFSRAPDSQRNRASAICKGKIHGWWPGGQKEKIYGRENCRGRQGFSLGGGPNPAANRPCLGRAQNVHDFFGGWVKISAERQGMGGRAPTHDVLHGRRPPECGGIFGSGTGDRGEPKTREHKGKRANVFLEDRWDPTQKNKPQGPRPRGGGGGGDQSFGPRRGPIKIGAGFEKGFRAGVPKWQALPREDFKFFSGPSVDPGADWGFGEFAMDRGRGANSRRLRGRPLEKTRREGKQGRGQIGWNGAGKTPGSGIRAG